MPTCPVPFTSDEEEIASEVPEPPKKSYYQLRKERLIREGLLIEKRPRTKKKARRSREKKETRRRRRETEKRRREKEKRKRGRRKKKNSRRRSRRGEKKRRC